MGYNEKRWIDNMILIPKNRYPEFMSFLHSRNIEVDYDAEKHEIHIVGYGNICIRNSGYLADEDCRPVIFEFFSLNG